MRPGAHCLIFMDQKEVASGDCCIILGGKEGVPTIVSNSEKKVWLLLKRLESFIHLQIGEHEKSLPRVEILWSFRFPLHFGIGGQVHPAKCRQLCKILRPPLLHSHCLHFHSI